MKKIKKLLFKYYSLLNSGFYNLYRGRLQCRTRIREYNCRSALDNSNTYVPTLNLGNIDGQIQGTNDAMVSIDNSILDVVASRVDEHPTLIPGARFHSGVLVNTRQGLHLPIDDG